MYPPIELMAYPSWLKYLPLQMRAPPFFRSITSFLLYAAFADTWKFQP